MRKSIFLATTESPTSSTKQLVSSGRHMRQQPQKSRRFKWLAIACVGVLLLAMGIAGTSLLRLRSNIQTDELNLGLGNTSNLVDGPLDILVIGSDSRLGANSSYGTADDVASGARSDVLMLVQISKDKKNVSVLSFPRDLMVDIPECKAKYTGKIYPESKDTQINESLSHGGPGCTVATVSNLIGINIDHFMLVDFNAVKALSNVIGGVDVCVTKAIDDSYSGLQLPAGISSVQGEQALAFLRSRHGFGDGSDTSRIAAQQSFLASLLRKVQAEGTLTNPSMTMNIAEAITQNVTVDQGLTNPATLTGMGSIFAGVNLSDVVFATVPHEPYQYDDNKLQLSSSANALFERLRQDQSMVEKKESTPTAQDSSQSSAAPLLTAPITVANGSGKANRGQEIANLIEDEDFTQVSSLQAEGIYPASSIYYPAGYETEAEALAQKLGIQNIQSSTAYAAITVLVGEDFTEGKTVEQKAQQKIAGEADGQTADEIKCQQSFEY